MVALMTGYVIAALLMASQLAGHHHVRSQPHHLSTPAPVSLKVVAGYGEQFRDQAWTPVRVTVHNRLSSNLTGTVSVADDNSFNNFGPPLPYHSSYEASVVLPAGGTKQVTLYIPGYDIQGEVDARFTAPGYSSATGADFVTGFGDSIISVGSFVTDPANASWLNRVNQTATLSAVHLTPSLLDPVPEALANFDVILISNVDSSQLDADQLSALEQYVHQGGALLLVGGPDWQETLRTLPPALVPGTLTGSRTLPDLRGLAGMPGVTSTPRGATTVSVLIHPRGTVLASEDGVPLVVREGVGSGIIEYLAFDPAVSPVPHWSSASTFLQHLITQAAPLAANRAAQPSNGPPSSPFSVGYGGPFDITSELANLPAAALPSLILFVILTVAYVVLIGPVNFLFLRRLRRRELMWLTVPALAVACVLSTFGIAFHLKGSTVVLNTVGVVSLDADGPHPATFYVGLFAPVRGDYNLTYAGMALPAAVPSYVGYSGPGQQQSSVGLRFEEGRQTSVTFASMNMWSMRDVAMHTEVSFPGTVRSHLTLDAHGDIVGTIHNALQFPLLHPVILAGQKSVHLPDIRSGGTITVHLRPQMDVFYSSQNNGPPGMWLYGRPQYTGGGYYVGPGVVSQGLASVPFGGGYCCPGSAPPPEKNLLDRIRNTASMLPDLQRISTLGEVVLLGWTQQPLGSFRVDGSVPNRRDLTAVEVPLSVGFPRSSFRLRSGTIGAQLVDDVPQQPLSNNGCCCPCPQPIYIGTGGSGTFAFDLPDDHTRFASLTLWVNAGGADGASIGHVYDWETRRWVHVDLSTGEATLRQPNRFISPWGAILLRLDATAASGDITIQSATSDLQLTGQAVQG